MTESYPPMEVKVWGEFACFTRPEMKVERVSYEVMTPSAARGILEAIFWKPEFQWRIRAIRVLRDVRSFSMLRNEVNTRASVRSARSWQDTPDGYFADDDRTQRHMLALRDVAYIIAADIVVRPGVQEDPAKYRDQFRRRVQRGQCHSAPYLGCREFTASFAPPAGDETPIPRTADLGRMLFDLAYATDSSGHGSPRFFEARLEQGILRVPPELYLREG